MNSELEKEQTNTINSLLARLKEVKENAII